MHTTNTQLPDYKIAQFPDPSAPIPDPAPSPISPFTIPHSPLLPPGSLTLLLGEPGAGKSLLALDLAARLSRGLPLPSFAPSEIENQKSKIEKPPAPASTIILSREDTPETLDARLAAANANLHFLTFPSRLLTLQPETPRRRGPNPLVISPLTKFLLTHLQSIPNPKLLILDPLPAYLGTADSSSASLIRSLLNPLLILAELHHLAILAISHLNKSTHKKNPRHRSLGSLAYTALARSVLLLTPDHLSLHRRILIPLKNNHAPLDRALAFNLHTPPNTPHAQAPSLLWEPDPLTQHPLLNPHLQSPDSSEKIFAQSQLDFALDFLHQTLADAPVPSKKLLQEARSLGISQRTLNRARFQLAVFSYREPLTGQWLSRLPDKSQLAVKT